jgi:nicotinic acid mononucleotide adenylyltransferase
MHWKIRRDPFLSKLAASHGEQAVVDAGFFFDEDPDDAPLDDVDWLCTPPPRRHAAPLRSAARPVVLLATGAFCPVHDGHLAMMDRAKDAAERAGYDVLGGYLSPGHDAYIRMKCASAAIPASARLASCARAAESTDWLSVDPWEALHRRVSVNYTDVTARLRAYLRARVDPRIDVLYVCGGDNARFALAFLQDAGCIVVGRPGADSELASLRTRLDREGASRVLFADGHHPAASRALRAPVWIDDRPRRLVLRLEDARAVRSLGLEPAAFAAFQRDLAALLAEHAHVRTTPLDEPATRSDAITLDAMATKPAGHALAVSRLFALGGYQLLGHVARPGAPPLAEQIARIPPGTYVLREDDRMTGGTLAAVRAMLPDHVCIAETELAVTHDPDEEVADSRDFLLGADDGGLVVALPDGTASRAPYVLPYVDPAARCAVARDRARAFSRDVWALGERTFRGSALLVADLPPATRSTFAFLGPSRTLEDVCRFHRDRLA